MDLAFNPNSFPQEYLNFVQNKSLQYFRSFFTVIRIWYSSAGLVVCQYHPCFQKRQPKYYRLISLTSIPCKVMEHIIFHHIMNHFDTLNILNPLQHGFRPNHSCQSQLISFVEDIQFSMNNHKQVDLLFLDFSKVFGTVIRCHTCEYSINCHFMEYRDQFFNGYIRG